MKGVGAAFRRWFGGFRVAYLPVLLTYLCFGASMVTSIALLYFEKDTLGLTPGEAAGIAFWLGLPWSMKMVVGVASDVRPIFGSRRGAYLIVGALCSLGGYAALAATVRTKAAYLAAMLLVAIGYMVQDVVADALTMFAITASLMNLALSASQPFTRYLNEGFVVSQHDYGNLGRLMVTVGAIGRRDRPRAVAGAAAAVAR